MKNKLEFTNIGNGLSPEQHEKIQKFLSKHADENISLTYEAIDNIRYYIHKYYRGYLLPDIIDSWGEYNAHFELKKMFLMTDIYSTDDIPKHHRKNCNIVIDINNNPISYIPSMSVLTQDEAIQYILKCENFLYVEIMGCLNPNHQAQAQEIRSQFI